MNITGRRVGTVPNITRQNDMLVTEDDATCSVCAEDGDDNPTEFFVNDVALCADHAREELDM